MRQVKKNNRKPSLVPGHNPGRFKKTRVSRSAFTTLTGILIICSFLGLVKADDSISWDSLNQSGHILLMRHALAPGTGDPENFKIEDCSTQRNLSESGRNQAKVIGQRLRNSGLSNVRVYSSQWCRCLETAKLLGLSSVAKLPALNSFFREFQKKESQTKALKTWLDSKKLDKPIVLVTHQVNITAFTGIFPQSGEIIVVKKANGGGFETIGRLLARP